MPKNDMFKNTYEGMLYAGDAQFNALFMPKVEQEGVLPNEIDDHSTPYYKKADINNVLDEIASIPLEAPEKYGDKLIGFAVMGNAFTKESFETIEKEIVGGSTIPVGFDIKQTGLSFYFENACGYDPRANTMLPYKVVPQARRNVQNMIKNNDEKAINESLSYCFNMLFEQAMSRASASNMQFMSTSKAVCDFVQELKERNIDPASLGITPEQIEKVEILSARRELGLRLRVLETELKQAGENLSDSDGPDYENDPRLNPELRDKFYERLAIESVLHNIGSEMEFLNDVYSLYGEEEKESYLAKRSATKTEKKILKDLDHEIKEAKAAVIGYAKNQLPNSMSKSQMVSALNSTGNQQMYETVYVDSVEDYDRLYMDDSIQLIEEAINIEITDKGFEHYLDNFKASLSELKEIRKKDYNTLNPKEQKKFKETYSKFCDELKNVSVLGTYEYPEAIEELSNKLFTVYKTLHLSVENEKLDKLFGVHPDKLKWGVTKDQHVAHIYTGKEPNMIELNHDEPKANDINEVSQKDAYKTLSDLKTEAYFKDLAMRAAKDYLRYGGDPYFAKISQSIKAYVLAPNRSGQQAALDSVYKNIKAFQKKYAEAAHNVTHPLNNAYTDLDLLKNHLNAFNNGALEIPEAAKTQKYNAKPKEPADANFGHVGKWTKFDGPIFPHEPSPNDIKQGKINDCFMMSSLIKLANDNPNKIRDSIKDNGDGTVTVRFFNNRNVDGRKFKEPVYVRVNKTVNKTLTGQHTYSSSSPWVQMVEKAYAVFMTDHYRDYSGNTNLKGFQRLDRGTSSMFMNAFEEDKYYSNAESEYGYSNNFYKNRYDYSKPKPDGYNDYEKELFDLISKTNKGEVMTVGSTVTNNPGLDKYLSSIGIHTNHAYAVLGTFEKDGKKYVQLQDPFASFRAGYDKNGKLVDNSALASATLNAGVPNMGKFNLEFNDFLRTFNSFSGLTQETFKEYRDVRDRHMELAKAEEKAKVTEAKAEEGNVKGGFFDDGLEIVGNYEATEHKEEPEKADKSVNDLAEEYDVIEKEEEKNFVDDFDIVEKPQENKDLRNYSKLEEARKNANDIIKSGITNENKVEKSIAIENEIAKAIACFTVNEMVAKYGEHMDQSQIDEMLSDNTINKAAQDIAKSEAFKRVMKDAADKATLKFFKEGNVEDFRPTYEKYTNTMKQVAAENAAPKKEQQIEKQQANVQTGPQV